MFLRTYAAIILSRTPLGPFGIRWKSSSSTKIHASLDCIRNIGVVAHVDHGKTTLTERMLYYTGMVRAVGDVDKGDTVTDFLPQEQERGITIQSAAVSFSWKEAQINLIDTPGHVDFTIEVERSLRVLDGAVVVIDAVAGVQAQTACVWRQADRYNVPRLVFVNKMDREGADMARAAAMLTDKLGVKPAILQLPVGSGADFSSVIDLVSLQQLHWRDPLGNTMVSSDIAREYQQEAQRARHALVETVAEYSDDVMQLYVDGKDVPADLLRTALRKATIERNLVPVLCGAAFRNKGVQPLLDAIVSYLPSPLDVQAPIALRKDGKEELVKPDANAPLVALAFKVTHDRHRGPLVFFRVYAGSMAAKSGLWNTTRGSAERPLQLLHVFANITEDVPAVSVGNIGAAVGLRHTCTGDTLMSASDRNRGVVLKPIEVPPPVFFCAVEAESSAAQPALDAALEALVREDPSLSVRHDRDTGQTLLCGMGELHLDVVAKRLQTEFNVNASIGRMTVALRESVSTRAETQVRFDRVMGTQRLLAELSVAVEPSSSNMLPVVTDIMKASWLRDISSNTRSEIAEAIVEGLRTGLMQGPLRGYPIEQCRISVVDGSVVDPSAVSAAAFRFCASQALLQATQLAEPVLLEPIMLVEIVCGEADVGKVLSDLSSKRNAVVSGVEVVGIDRMISAQVPLTNMQGYSTALRNITRGEGSFTMHFLKYGATSGTAEE